MTTSNHKIFILFILVTIFFVSIWTSLFSSTQSTLQDKFDRSNIYLSNLLKENPDDPSILTNLGHLHWQFGNVDLAYSYLQKALKKNSDFDQALFDLGMIYWHRGSSDKALSFMEKVYRSDTLNFGHACRYALLLSRSKDSSNKRKAANIFQEFESSRDSLWIGRCYKAIYAAETGEANARDQLIKATNSPGCYALASLALAQLFMRKKNYEDACIYYQKGLENIETNEDLLFVLPHYDILLPEEEKKLLPHLNPRAKGNFLASFWQNLDPTPLTPTNERLLEHYRRLEYANVNYYSDKSNNLDDRARIYIKYGEPDERYSSTVSEYSKSNETWTYFSKFPDLSFDFVEFGSGFFRIVNDLSAALIRSFNYDMYGLDEQYQRALQNIYSERAQLGGVYSKIAAEEIGPENIFDQIDRYTRSVRMAQSAAPATIYELEFNAKPLNFPFRWCAFKGKNSTSLLEVVYGIPTENLPYTISPEGILIAELDFSAVITDLTQNPVKDTKKRIVIDQKQHQGIEPKIHLGRWRCYLPEGTYPIALSAKTADQSQYGLYFDTLQVANFSRPTVMVSGIELSLDIKDFQNLQHHKNSDAKSHILPYPFPQVLRTKPIYVYFEIYNLERDTNGQTNYRIYYSLQSLPVKKVLFEKILSKETKKSTIIFSEDRKAEQTDMLVCYALDLHTLPVGPTRYRIMVQDLNANCQAESEIVFTLR